MKKYYLLLLFVIISFNLFCQKKIDSLYYNYFENTREVPYLHLNKTTFLKGEEIWFKAYVIEQNSNKLHTTTSNLYVSIFDEKGKLKDQQLIRVKDGVGKGNISIDSTFTMDAYYLKASTNWMKNYAEDNSYLQSIRIISSSSKEVKSKSISENEYFEFKLFPEGGHLLASTTNNLGILIKDVQNKGIKVDNGIIKNRKGEVVGEFKTNRFGLGKSSLFFGENDFYIFEAELPNGTILKQQTPKIEKTGIILHTTYDKDAIKVNIITNSNSLISLNKKKYRVFIHNTRSFKNFYFSFNKESTIYSLNFQKKELSKGVNIITLFNEEDKPVLEKIIFNESEDLYSEININRKKLDKDSTLLTISNLSNEKIFLSASFLPSKSKAYNPKNNIKSSILLKPYIKGYIEDPTYYFDKNNKNRLEDLELLFLTQGWSKFSWNLIFNSPPKTEFSFENGINITAHLPKTLKKKQSILIFSSDNNLVEKIDSTKNSHILKNTFIKKNSIINFSFNNRKNQYKILPTLSYSQSSLLESFNLKNLENKENIELQISDFKSISKGFEVLNEVVIKAKKSSSKNNPFGSETMLRKVSMKNILGKESETVFNFLLFKGFSEETSADGITYLGPRRRKSFTTINGNINGYVNPFVGIGVVVYLDNINITNRLWVIESMYLSTVKEIFYGDDPSTTNEVVYIYTLPVSEFSSKKEKFSEIKTPVGFANNKEYYNPKYPSFINDTYKFYGSLFWNPSLILKPNSKLELKLPNNSQNNFIVFFEGVSETGKLLSFDKLIEVEK